MRSFLKWPGGKYKLVPKIKEILPKGERLVEPFVGAGSVFLNTNYDYYLINDLNRDLINVYRALIEHKDDFIWLVDGYFIPENNDEDVYYELRDKFNDSTTDWVEKSAIFIYLNKHGFNGLCRYNKSDEYNTPFGKYKSVKCPIDEMKHFVSISDRVELMSGSYEKCIKSVSSGDVIYADPPYLPLDDQKTNFVGYAGNNFGIEDQKRLVELMESVGVPCVTSNHWTPTAEKLYKNWEITLIDVRRSISRGERRKVKEMIGLYNPEDRK